MEISAQAPRDLGGFSDAMPGTITGTSEMKLWQNYPWRKELLGRASVISDIRAFFDIGKPYMKVYHTNSDCQEILAPVFQACW